MSSILSALLLAAALDGEAAEPGLSLQGTVLDSSRAAIASAQVTLAPEGPGQTLALRTDASGRFRLSLDPGSYRLTVSVPGFLDAVETLQVSGAGRETREFVLQPAPYGETVTVVAPAGYRTGAIASATKTLTPLLDVPQSVTVTTQALVKDQLMTSFGDLVRYVPGIQAHQGENNRDQVIIRGNSSSADFFLNGVRDDVQYYRDFYNLERVEALKGPNAMVFGRGGGG